MVAKIKKKYICKNCNSTHNQWVGKCHFCDEWNTIEEVLSTQKGNIFTKSSQSNKEPIHITEISTSNYDRIPLHDQEINMVLGGGLVLGSVTLFAGAPGIGKSTLLLQTALQNTFKTLYVSGEESEQQIKLRASRIHHTQTHCFVLCETNIENILAKAQVIQAEIIIIDSVQTIYSDTIDAPISSISQIKESTQKIIEFSKQNNVISIIIGHINKDGMIAGPKILEHMVDTVLHFEGNKDNLYRIIRTTKHRFGSTNAIAIYQMQEHGLIPVENPSTILIDDYEHDNLNGTIICCALDGIKPMLVEVQALVTESVYGTPQRSTTGFDTKRLHMLLAVLEKKCKLKLSSKDIFLNITGGLKIQDTAIDLGVICAIISSYIEKNISNNICFAAEVGLSGEIRPVPYIEQRINEASKLGYQYFITSKYSKNIPKNKNKLNVIKVSKVQDLVKKLEAI